MDTRTPHRPVSSTGPTSPPVPDRSSQSARVATARPAGTTTWGSRGWTPSGSTRPAAGGSSATTWARGRRRLRAARRGCIEVVGPVAATPYGDVRSFGREHAGDGLVVYLGPAGQRLLDRAGAALAARLASWFEHANAILIGRVRPDAPDLTQTGAVVDALGDLRIPVVPRRRSAATWRHVPPLVNSALARVVVDGDRNRITPDPGLTGPKGAPRRCWRQPRTDPGTVTATTAAAAPAGPAAPVPPPRAGRGDEQRRDRPGGGTTG